MPCDLGGAGERYTVLTEAANLGLVIPVLPVFRWRARTVLLFGAEYQWSKEDG